MRTWRWYSKLALAVGLAAFAFLVWPTPWMYVRFEGAGQLARVNRLTGTVERVGREGRWVPIGRPDPPVRSVLDELDALVGH